MNETSRKPGPRKPHPRLTVLHDPSTTSFRRQLREEFKIPGKARQGLFFACKEANVSRFTPHGLRRMVVNRLMRARVDPGTAAALTGHSVQVMLRYYRTVTDEDRREATELANLGVLVEDDDSRDDETRPK